MATIGEPVDGGTEGSVLFIDSATKLAQDNAGFYFDQENNTLKSADAGSGAASENLTVSTGFGGAGTTGAPAAGNSGDLLLKTGAGGSDPSGTAGSGGNIIIQPGSSGGGSGGLGGSTIVRAPANAPGSFFAIQSDTGASTYWSVTNIPTLGMLTGTRPLSITHNSTAKAVHALFVNGAGVKSDAGDFTALNVGSTATSSAGGKNTGLAASAVGDWSGTGAENRALVCRALNGAKNFAAIFDAGNVGVNELDPTARLHIAAGDATIAPLKLNAQSNLLSAPSAGAVEWDGTKLYITSGVHRKELTNSHVADVFDFGAKGDGITDDSAAIQAAVKSLADLDPDDGKGTGGIVYLPANKIYKVNFSINIQSNRAIWIVSDMHHGMLEAVGGGQGESYGNGYILPGDDITGGIFHWWRLGTNRGRGGGGGLFHVAIADPPTVGHQFGRQRNVDAGVFVEDAVYFDVENCYFSNLKGSAIKIGHVIVCRIHSGRIYRCGDANKPAVHVHGSGDFAGAYVDRVIIEGSHKAPSVQVESGTGLALRNSYCEANDGEPELQYSFVKILGGATILGSHFGSLGPGVTQVDISPSGNSPFNRVLHSSFGGAGRAILLGDWAQFAQICGNVIRDAGDSSEDAITVTNGHAQIVGNMLYSSGRINFSGAGGVISQNYIHASLATSGTEITAPAGTVIEGNFGVGSGSLTWDPGYLADGAGETSATIAVPGASFGDFVEVAAPYDLQGILANGYVSSAGNVRIRLQNATGAEIDLDSGTWKVRLRRG